jgi:predicted aldo/keto reductase-like oxidoreductase
LPEAVRLGMGVIGMKVFAAGALLRNPPEPLAPAEAMGYVLSLPGVSTVVIGCSSPGEVDQNATIARAFTPFDGPAIRALEERTRIHAGSFTSYKKPA